MRFKNNLTTKIRLAALFFAIAAVMALASAAAASDTAGAGAGAYPGISSAGPLRVCKPHESDTLYTVGYSHLDTQWRWTFQDSIYYYIANTMRDNFKLFEEYPGYTFNFTGSKRYIMMKEYYPEDYKKLKEYIAKGRWIVSGSSVDENDANVPSTESLVRNVLYGNLYFKQEFGEISEDYMLPDCFGFPAFMPSVLAHAGVKGFSTQKLSWSSAVGIPFNVGKWIGPDGRYVIGALNPGAYVSKLRNDLSRDESWLARTRAMGKQTGFFADFKYFGTGDQGGAPDGESASWLQKSLDGDGPLCVKAAGSDDIFQDANKSEVEKMTTHKGDMLLIEHSAGSLTSQAYIKRWNRKNELLADDAERASLIANWLGAIPYPTDSLREIWYLILGGQMHDILPGTSVPKAYEFSWNDAVVALNNSAGIVESAAGAAAAQLDTNTAGQPVIAYNPLSGEREDIARATLRFGDKAPAAVRVFDSKGMEVPSQIIKKNGAAVDIIFLAKTPSVGFSVFDARPSAKPYAFRTGLSVTQNSLENNRFKVTIDINGDVSSVYDKAAKREVLSAPAKLELMEDAPRQWPAWNIDWEDWKKPPRETVKGPAKIRIAENGPARVALEITRVHEGSTFTQTVSLAANGSRIEFDTALDWRTQGACLKAAFPLTVASDNANYNLELGVIQRSSNNPTKYEVPSHQWFDLTDKDGGYGVSILEDSKFGSDKPSDNTVRLTLVRTPGCTSYCDQATQDLGRHRILYAMAPHLGDWRKGSSHWQAMRLNQPITTFTAPKHPGRLGRSFSFIKVSNPQVAIRAAKKAEESDWTIIRLQELNGAAAPNTKITFPVPVTAAFEVDGQERKIGPATVKGGALVVDMQPFYMRAFAVKIAKTPTPVAQPVSVPVALNYDAPASTKDNEKTDAGFDGIGNSYSADLLPGRLDVDGITFKLAPGGAGAPSTVTCKGQTIELPKGKFAKLYILAAATAQDAAGSFSAGGKTVTIGVQKWNGFIGQWDNRIWKNDREIFGLRPAFIKRDRVAWFGSHLHNQYGTNVAYNYTYLFKYAIPLAGAASVTLPDDPRIRIFAATAVAAPMDGAVAAQLLYDDFDTPQDTPVLSPAEGKYNDSVFVNIRYPWYSSYDEIRYNTDQSDLTRKSPQYRSPVLINDRTVIQARAYASGGREGLLTIGKYEINDTTPPGVKSVEAYDLAPAAIARLTEPVDKQAAETPGNYAVEPGISVQSATLAADNMTVSLALDSTPANGKTYSITVRGLADKSKNANALKSPVKFDFATIIPAYSLKIRTKDIAYNLGVPGVSRDYAIEGKPKAVTGAFGLALRLNGENDMIAIDDRPELDPVNSITIAAWINPADWNSNRRILQKGSEDNQYRLVAENGQLLFELAGIGKVSAPLPAAGQWRHIAATFDGSALRLFIDGKPVAEQPAAGTIPMTGDPLCIGAKHKGSGELFKGDIDKIMIYGTALPPEHIAILARSK